MKEADLIRDCQAGNQQSFGKLYDIYVRDIYDFIYYKTHHKQTAEDITSETFFKALQKIKQVDPSRSFKSWLYKIAQNTVVDHYRKSSRETLLDDAWDAPSDDDIVADLDMRERISQLRKHLSKLPSIQRDIVIMRVWQDLSYREISDIVGKSEGNCKVIYSRALQALKEHMSVAALLLLLIKL